MNLEDLKLVWEDSGRKLDKCLLWNASLLRESRLRKAETALRRLFWLLGFEVALDVCVLLMLGSFAADHVAAPRFLLPALVLGVCVILLAAAAIRQMAAISALDYASPVLEIQKRFEALRRERLVTLKYSLMLGPLLWTPLCIVAVKWLIGLDVYAVASGAWLASNLIFGLAVIPVAIWISRRYSDRLQRSPLLRTLARDLAGYNLAAAQASLASLNEFGDEQSGDGGRS